MLQHYVLTSVWNICYIFFALFWDLYIPKPSIYNLMEYKTILYSSMDSINDFTFWNFSQCQRNSSCSLATVLLMFILVFVFVSLQILIVMRQWTYGVYKILRFPNTTTGRYWRLRGKDPVILNVWSKSIHGVESRIGKWVDSRVGLVMVANIIPKSITKNRSPNFQAVVSHFTDWGTCLLKYWKLFISLAHTVNSVTTVAGSTLSGRSLIIAWNR
jgi:hypothetical protein